MFGFEGASASAPIDATCVSSKIGVQTRPPLIDFQTPPPGVPLLTVMDTSSLIARAHIPQDQAAQLHPGDAATVHAPGEPEVPGKVTLVSPALDPNSTTVEIWIEVPNTDGGLRPGTTVTAEMVAKTVNEAIVVPVAAALKTP